MGEGTGEPLRVGSGEVGARLDAFLASRLGVSRARARRLLAQGSVSVDGRPAAAAAKGALLAAGALVEVCAPANAADERPVAEPGRALRLLAEGQGWVALDKPAGVPVHPLVANETGTLLNALVARFPQVAGVGEGGLRSGVVHRLDVDTSGVVLFATAQRCWERLRAAFAEHRVEKRYRALVLGHLTGEGREEVGLIVARHRPARVRVIDPRHDARGRGARSARLRWRALAQLGPATLVEVDLETGHLHQVRATFAHRGHPVAGDRLYGPGPGEDPTGAERQMLHATRVRVEEILAESPDPPDFSALLARLREAHPAEGLPVPRA